MDPAHHRLKSQQRGEETNQKDKGTRRGINTRVKPTKTFTSTNWDHVETEPTYRDTTEVLGVLTTCHVCVEHAAIRVTGGYEGCRSQL